jgi:MFS family permease
MIALAAAPAVRTRARIQVAVLALGGLSVSLVHTLVVPLLPVLPRLLGAGSVAVSWLVTSTLLASAIATPVLGRLGDQYGRRRMLLVALGLLVAGSALSGSTSDLSLLIAGRALQGCATAVIPLAISIINTNLPGEHRASGIALLSATLGFGGAIGLPVSGLVVEYADFHLLFWLIAAVGTAVGIAVWLAVPEPADRSGGPVDFTGALLLATVLGALLLPLSNGGMWGWTSPLTLGLFGAFAAAAPLFVGHQNRHRRPLVDMRTLRRRPILLTNVVSVLVGFALYANFLGTASYVEAPAATGYGFGVSTLVGGLCMLPGGAAMMALSPFAGRMISRRGPRLTLVLGSLVIAVGYLARIVLTHGLWQVLVASTIASVGAAVAYSAMPALILDAAPADESAAATGINALARGIGTSLASAVATVLLGALTVTIAEETFPTRTAFLFFFLCGAATAAFAALIMALAGRPRTTGVPDES